jgi:hypothetical protein
MYFLSVHLSSSEYSLVHASPYAITDIFYNVSKQKKAQKKLSFDTLCRGMMRGKMIKHTKAHIHTQFSHSCFILLYDKPHFVEEEKAFRGLCAGAKNTT